MVGIADGVLRRVVLAGALAFSAVLAVGLLAVSKSPASPFDEAAHLDYLFKVSEGHIPKVGEPYGQQVLGMIACEEHRGSAWAGLEPCGSPVYDPAKAPFQGLSSATGAAPTYYVLTAIPFRVCTEVTGFSARVCARASNVLWLAGAAAATSALILLLGQGFLVSVAVGTGWSLVPAVFVEGVNVNPDAAVQALVPTLFLLAVVLALSRVRSRWQILVLGLASVFTVTLKETALVGATLAFLFFGFVHVSRFSGRAKYVRIAWLVGAWGLVCVAVAVVVWVQPFVRGVGSLYSVGNTPDVPLGSLTTTLAGAIPFVVNSFQQLVWPPLTGSRFELAALCLAMLGWAMCLQIRTPALGDTRELPVPVRRLASSSYGVVAFVGALILPLVLGLATFVVTHAALIQPRYYMATAATLGAVGIGTTSNRYVAWLGAGALTLNSALVVWALLGKG